MGPGGPGGAVVQGSRPRKKNAFLTLKSSILCMFFALNLSILMHVFANFDEKNWSFVKTLKEVTSPNNEACDRNLKRYWRIDELILRTSDVYLNFTDSVIG